MSTGTSSAPPTPARATAIGELVSRALAVYRARPGLFLAIAAVTVVPVGVISVLAGVAADDLGGASRVAAVAALNIVPAVLLVPISGAAATVATLDDAQGRRATLGTAFAPVLARFWPMVGALVLSTLGVAAGLMVFLVPGIILLVLWLFAAQAATVEARGPRDALRRSHDLVRGAWWGVFLAWLVIQVLTAAAQVVVGLPGRLVAGPLDGAAETAVAGAWGTLSTLIVQPFALVAVALLYLDRTLCLDGALPPGRGLTRPAAAGR